MFPFTLDLCMSMATGELRVFDFDLEREDRCSVADKVWDSL